MPSTKVQITKTFEFDAGHRLPDHGSKCANLHGHRYRLEVTLTGEVIQQDGHEQNGMVVDFSEVKEIVNETVVKPWDHAFLVYSGDTKVRDFLASLPGHKTVVLPVVPSAENMVAIAFEQLQTEFSQRLDQRVQIMKVRLYETPTSWAEIDARS